MRKKLTEADILLGLVTDKALAGVHEKDILVHLPVNLEGAQALAQKLESEGKLRILSFSPLHVVSRAATDFLGDKVLAVVGDFNAKHPKDAGIPLARLENRFKAPDKVLLLTLKTLVHEGRLRSYGDAFALPGFVRALPPREEKVLAELEALWLSGGLRAISIRDVRDARHLTPQKLQTLLGILIERKKIVESKEGFYVHQSWLDDVLAKIRATGRRELTVADFKALTGLSRKFAIPLLEMLDEMGITRRRGSSREIL
jgi:selenocysteine-specific elongation factor